MAMKARMKGGPRHTITSLQVMAKADAIGFEEDAEAVSPQLTLFAEAFPVSPTPWLAAVPVPPTSATSGRNSLDSFASLDPDGSWRKTCQGYSQVTLDGSLERFSETWPRAGMVLSGIAYRLPHLEPLTDVIASGLWPTPTEDGNYNRKGASKTSGDGLATAARNWPTPNAGNEKWGGTMQEWGGSGSWVRAHPELATGQLNPAWVSVLMGYPPDWTEIP
jgi:DNA (cytosine-5)-methyltransferase 1